MPLTQNEEFNLYSNIEMFQDMQDTPENLMTPDLSMIPDKPKLHKRIAKGLWMLTINFYDFVGLMELLPCGTLHSTKPYVSYFYK